MTPMPSDPNTTSPIDRDELRALVRRARDTSAQPAVTTARTRRVGDVVVHREAVAAWLDRTEASVP